METEIVLGGVGEENLHEKIKRMFDESKPKAIGIASAFVTVNGVQKIIDISRSLDISEYRLVVGLDHFITQPQALVVAREAGWCVRIGKSEKGIFHPKLIIGGSGFANDGLLLDSCCVYIGSGNLTSGGLEQNVECAFISGDTNHGAKAAGAFQFLWRESLAIEDGFFERYSAKFSERNRNRSIDDIKAFEISDKFRNKNIPLRDQSHASAAWVELKSFTGEYALQIELPRKLGELVARFIDGRVRNNGKVKVQCQDNEIREMKFDYYQDNSMYRLNIPNDFPDVSWVRENRNGIVLLNNNQSSDIPISLKIIRPGNEMNEIIQRTEWMGIIESTRTRHYGWY